MRTATLSTIGVMTNNVSRMIAVLVTACTLASCTNGTKDVESSVEPKPIANEQVAWANIWSAEQGIDIFSRSGELVRGTVEAGYIAQIYGVEASFPGYRDTLVRPLPDYDAADREPINWAYYPARPRTETTIPDVKTLFYHLLELQSDGTTITGAICTHSEAPTRSRTAYVFSAIAVTLSNEGTEGGRPGIVDSVRNSTQIPGKVPTWNIFSPWQIARSQLTDGDDIPDRCTDWWMSVFPTAVLDQETGALRVPKPAPPPASMTQYPKWIGPSNSE